MIEFYYDEERTRKDNAEYYQELGEERGLKIGEERGLKIGQTNDRQDSILDLLSFKGNIPDKLKNYILNQSNFDTLKSWFKHASYCSSISDFCQAIGFTE